MTRENVTLPLDNGGQGCFQTVMANQRLSNGEPPCPADGDLRRPEAIGEPETGYDQPHFRDIAPKKSAAAPEWMARLSDEEVAAIAATSVAALDGPPPPPKGLPGVELGYDLSAQRLIRCGIEYLDAWLNGEPRRMVNLNREVAEVVRAAYLQGRADERLIVEKKLSAPPIPARSWSRQEAIEAAQVYFILSESGGIKIGVASDPEKRLRRLQTAHPVKLSILALCPGGYEQERAYHERFAAHRLHGEWFEPHPDILAEVDRLNPHKSRTVCSGDVLA